MRKCLIILSLFLAACAISPQIAESWKGAQAEQLVEAWGAPHRERMLTDGRRELIYSEPLHLAGVLQGCEARFETSAENVISRVTVDGMIAGCNRLLRGKPAYMR